MIHRVTYTPLPDKIELKGGINMENKTGAFIAQLRKEHHLTQKELAEKINVTDKAISRWETGKGLPEVSLLIPLADTLHVSVNELLTGERVEQDKIIDNANKVIVETITKSNRTVSTYDILLFIIFCIIQLAVFYILPLFVSPRSDLPIVFPYMFAVIINSISIGFIKSKLKFLTPVLTALMFVPMGLIEYENISPFDGEALAIYALVFMALSIFGMLLGMLIKCIITAIKKRLSK